VPFAPAPFWQSHTLRSQALDRALRWYPSAQEAQTFAPDLEQAVPVVPVPLLHEQDLLRHVSAVLWTTSYPSEHAVVWLLLALLHRTPSFEFTTTVHDLQTVLHALLA
jgi:hypothetical protein